MSIPGITDEDETAGFHETYGIHEDSTEEEPGAARVLSTASWISSMTDEEPEPSAETLGTGSYNMDTSLYSCARDDIIHASGAAAACYFSGYAGSDQTDDYDTALEKLTSGTLSSADAAGYLCQITAKRESDGGNLANCCNGGVLSSHLPASVSVPDILTESYESGGFYSTSEIVWSGTDGDPVLNSIYELPEACGYSSEERQGWIGSSSGSRDRISHCCGCCKMEKRTGQPSGRLNPSPGRGRTSASAPGEFFPPCRRGRQNGGPPAFPCPDARGPAWKRLRGIRLLISVSVIC